MGSAPAAPTASQFWWYTDPPGAASWPPADCGLGVDRWDWFTATGARVRYCDGRSLPVNAATVHPPEGAAGAWRCLPSAVVPKSMGLEVDSAIRGPTRRPRPKQWLHEVLERCGD